MSYIVPRDKPSRCTNCPFMDRITYDCKLMYGYDYSDFKTQYKNCPLVEIPTSCERLIDVNTITAIYFSDADGEHCVSGEQLYDLEIEADTVIEAEGE